MITPELISFIKSELAKGKLQEQIRSELATGGWNASDLEEAFSFILKIPLQPIQTVKPVQPIQSPITQPITPITPITPIAQPIQPITPIAQPIQPLQPNTPIIQPIQTGFVSANSPISSKPKPHSKVGLFFVIFLIIFGGAFAGWYFFKPEIMNIIGTKDSVDTNIVEDNKEEVSVSDKNLKDNLRYPLEICHMGKDGDSYDKYHTYYFYHIGMSYDGSNIIYDGEGQELASCGGGWGITPDPYPNVCFQVDKIRKDNGCFELGEENMATLLEIFPSDNYGEIFMQAVSKWASSGDKEMPPRWVSWEDTIKGVSVKKKGPVDSKDSSYIISGPVLILKTLGSNRCIGDTEETMCAIGENSEVIRYFDLISYYW